MSLLRLIYTEEKWNWSFFLWSLSGILHETVWKRCHFFLSHQYKTNPYEEQKNTRETAGCEFLTLLSNFDEKTTTMHSSRMRTVRCSGRRVGVCPGGVCPGGVGPSTCWDTSALWTESQTPVKHNLAATMLRTVNICYSWTFVITVFDVNRTRWKTTENVHLRIFFLPV